MKVAVGANGEWAKFKEEMQRRFKFGDGLLTKEDLEMLRWDEFSIVGSFATAFEKMAKKVPGLAEEEQCATFLGHFKNWEGSSLTKKVASGKKLTWAAIKEGVMDGELDQVDIFQMRQARKKRKALDVTTSDGRDFKKMIEDAVAQLDAEKEAKRKTMAAPQTVGKAKKAVVQDEEEEEEEKEPEPQKLTKAQRKARNLAQGGQGSGRGQVPQAVAMPPPESSHQAAPAPYGPWPGCGGGEGWTTSGSQCGQEGGRGAGRGRIDWRNAICWHCGQKGYTIKFCHVRRNDEDEGLISTNYDGDMYDKGGYHLDPRIPGGTRKEALRRAEAGEPPAPPAMFQIWQEKGVRSDTRVEEVGENEEVEQERKADTTKVEPLIVESDDEIEEDYWNRPLHIETGEDYWRTARQTMENMEDLMDKIRRYQGKMVDLCEEVKELEGQRPQVFIYGLGPKSQGAPVSILNVSVTGGTPRSGMSFRPPSRSGRAAQAVRTRARGPASPKPPAKDIPGPSREKEVVEPPVNEEEEDDHLRNEEDEKAEQRAKKRGVKADTEKAPEQKKKKYTVRVEKGFDVEEIMDRILEGHNHLMNLKDVLASEPRLREELKAHLCRKMVASVRLGVIIPKEAEWSKTGTKMDWKSVACGCFDVVVKGKACTTMMNTSAKMNLIKKEDALRLRMEIDRFDNGILVGANSRSIFVGTASKVVLEIGKWMMDLALADKHQLGLTPLWRSHAKRERRGRASGTASGDNQIENAGMGQKRRQTTHLHRRERRTISDRVPMARERVWMGWSEDVARDERNIAPEGKMTGFIKFVRRFIRQFVKSVVERVMHWGDCRRLLRGYYNPGRQAEERRSLESKRKEPEAEGRRTFERGTSSRSQEGERRREHSTHRMERRGELPAERSQRRRESEVSEAPPQSIQRPEDQSMAEVRQEAPREVTEQRMDEDQAAREKDLDRQERAAREQEIRAEVRRKNLEELHRRVEQGQWPVDLKDKKGKSVSNQQEEDPPLLFEAWENFDRLMGAARGPEGPQQEMGVKLVLTDLLTLKGVMKEGFAAARASDQKIGERLTKVAQKAYGQRVEWEQETRDLKENQKRQDREFDAMKVELEKAWAGNEAIRQVNQTLDKVNEALRAYLQAQQASFQAKEVKWEKRIKELEAQLEQRAPTALVDWTEVQGFEMKRPPAEEAFKSQKEEKKANLQA
ncbi:hypothetical protein CBR_g45448 [Chara braunii]|uniref:Uncharacterized protein n=1 Tax=Chara braunii TaxID=69332 RepID=A0A388LYP8_CHABU|nr:hypothetical protein CBR_g45448 [Chara braunii]|eukprot:GBG87391.1 hypothetical protein CBR_g45448 [Chara braunii]